MIPDDPVAPFVAGDGRTGVLLVHGFAATPYEMRALALFLAEHGYRVSNVRLAGHAQGEAALALTRWPDWWKSVLDAYEALAAQCDRVFLAGLSMGGLLGLKLASERTLVGAAIYAAPITYHNPLVWAVPFLMRVIKYGPRRTSNIRDPEALAHHHTSGRATLANTYSLIQLSKHVDALLPRVRCPLLLIYSRNDRVVPYANMAHVAASVSSADVSTATVERSGHVITVDYDKEIVQQQTLAFFNRLAGVQVRVAASGR